MSAVSVVTFGVHGDPAPQGSKRHVGGGRMIEMSKKVGPWRDAVHNAARAELLSGRWGDTFHHGPLRLDITFHYAMPRKRTKAERALGVLWRCVTPDLDKLIRSTGDALTSSELIHDDGQFAQIQAEKVETVDGWSGAVIRITRLPVSPVSGGSSLPSEPAITPTQSQPGGAA